MTNDQLRQAKQLMAQGLSQRHAAERLGIPRSTLGDRLRAEKLAPVQTPVQSTVSTPVQCRD
jgi:hypothetical protein